MFKTLVLFESHSGFTEKIAREMALILGPALCSRTSEFDRSLDDYDFFVICTPGYSGIIDQTLLTYIKDHSARISAKRVVLLCTCLDEEEAFQCLAPLRKLLGSSVELSTSVQGEAEDRIIHLSLEIKRLRDEGNPEMETWELDKTIDDFVLSHNTCALATGAENAVRATPIEYSYLNGFFYFLSEGGEKFANLLRNHTVSLCIYDEYKSMATLGGMQITGEAELISVGSDEYRSVLDHKKLSHEKLLALPVTMNMIKVTVKKIEYLNSAFAAKGYSVRQIRSR
jgi:uncharacterized protein YhbP (UPF0306 family)